MEHTPDPHLDSGAKRTQCWRRSAIFLSASAIRNATPTTTWCLLKRELPCAVGIAMGSAHSIKILVLPFLMVGDITKGGCTAGGVQRTICGVSGLMDVAQT